jgi:DNA modification methylase
LHVGHVQYTILYLSFSSIKPFLEFSDLNYWHKIVRTKIVECQGKKNEHFRHLYEFNRGSKAEEAARNICAVYGEDSIAERTAQEWLERFKQGNSDMSDTPRSGQHLVGYGGDYPL